MHEFLTEIWESLFHRERKPPEGAQRMYEALEELEESSKELRNKLEEYPEYFIQSDPIREHVMPNYTRRR